MVLDHRFQKLEPLRSALQYIVYPVQYSVNAPFKIFDWLGESLASRDLIQEENRTLRAKNQLLEVELQKFTALEIENMRLRGLLEASIKVHDRVLVAEILRVNLDPYQHQLVLNKGNNHNIKIHQPIIDSQGVMGQIVHVGPLSSTAMLITDLSHAIPVRNSRTDIRSIALGTGDLSKLRLLHVPNNADIQVGDILLSSGLGGRFPPDYPVAMVTIVEKDPSKPFAYVEAKPSANLSRSQEVLIVWTAEETLIPSQPLLDSFYLNSQLHDGAASESNPTTDKDLQNSYE
jgi:rod shape-determining protein MreC